MNVLPAVIVKWSNLREIEKARNWNEGGKIRNEYYYWNNRIFIEEFEQYIVGHRRTRDYLTLLLREAFLNIRDIHRRNQQKGYRERLTHVWEIGNILIAF